MKYIQLTQNKKTIVDDEDYERLSKRTWYYANGYACQKTLYSKNRDRKIILMQKVIMNADKKTLIDHINRDKLDNRKSNLRTATHGQNNINGKIRYDNTSGYRGVSFQKKWNKWVAMIKVNGKHIYLGGYTNPLEASRAYENASRKYFGGFTNV